MEIEKIKTGKITEKELVELFGSDAQKFLRRKWQISLCLKVKNFRATKQVVIISLILNIINTGLTANFEQKLTSFSGVLVKKLSKIV